MPGGTEKPARQNFGSLGSADDPSRGLETRADNVLKHRAGHVMRGIGGAHGQILYHALEKVLGTGARLTNTFATLPVYTCKSTCS
jgi:hypothetical protein